MTLHDQLERLAERAEPEAGPTGRELWDRGTRYRRRMRAGTASIAAVTLLGLAVLTGVSIGHAGPSPEPVPADAPAGLPPRIWDPSPWLAGSAEAGPPGQVITVIENQLRRSWTTSTYGVVAVSAATGDYRFLDLPRLALGDFTHVALAPDGRHVAYWTTGSSTGAPNTTSTFDGLPVTGFAVYDVDSGEVRTHSVPTRHGLRPDTLTWTGPSTFVASYLQQQGGGREGFATDGETWVWDVPGDAPVRATEPSWLSAGSWSIPSSRQVLLTGRRSDRILDGTTLEVLARPPHATHLDYGAGIAVSPDGTRIAGLWTPGPGTSRSPSPVAVARLDDTADATRVRSGPSTYVLVGWTDDDHVAALGTGGPDGSHSALLEVDVDDGSSRELMVVPNGLAPIQWATDLLGSPVVDRPAPPRPLDPRWVTAGLATLVIAGLFSLWGWRRRVRP
ncbi:hypothetical protein GCM10009623_37570 [Nocardioides aestuarii]|uniref:WD40 repeat domain-containing protein n=1 Tax=Nocardioides aestuarii TaxID=252231 RepID=A0ABW4TTH9_9ACTN